MRLLTGIVDLEQAVGTHLGYRDWHQISQEQVDLFARATGDDQWIHVDPERAAAGPFGTTIAHGFLTLSLLPYLIQQVYRVDGLRIGINYGADSVRFPAIVPVDSWVRAGVELLHVERGTSGSRCRSKVTVERAGGGKPVCVAETVAQLVE
ncbi:Enoyl-CoA hydratase (plasmid) [Pseudonocardia dioxanivorans CB1190]|uniref:Enoyl-CoA hydratase n=1 Tax=Pseudonocardia dioxanivorans (strain ATCC 55486 / DSM 44775 / JCM 13855 / CB1190) TaxID=675635 RepID=F2L6G1_PSEUX|nr:MaoC family dehydratase [Pseudonocardia dioxanivorans]AEA28855.1 Enoyl-CoA hydratase [Pseudonocardia dioxanivorans CB1190]